MVAMNIRIDNNLKKKIDDLADNLGISTNQLINLKLREFVDNGTINIDLYKDKKSKYNIKIPKTNNGFGDKILA